MQQRLLVLLLVLILGLAAFRPVHSEEPSTGDIDTAKTDAEVQSQGTDVYDTFNSDERAALSQNSEKHEFQAEVSRLMDIIINSLYSNREIFLRELISNAADALDKIRYLSLTDPSQLSTGSTLDIKISFDKDHRTLTITDTGVGMNKTQLIQNLGIVARSGTTEFLKASQSGTDALSLIGQFGVGFYSVYLVADRVTVASKANGDDQHVWESTAQSTFTIAKDPRGDTLGRGTQLVLHLKEDALEYTNEPTLERIIGKYSEFINFPIYLQVSKEVEKEIPVEEEDKEDKKDEDVSVSDEEDDTKDKPKTKKVKEWVKEWKRMNEAKAIWTRPAKDVTEEEYADFYKALTKDDNGHQTKVHFTAEGEISFKAILYIPKKAPTGLYDRFYDKQTSLKLYVRRVLISEEFEDFLPRYLNFIRGVVDSEDLPLNVSRETLAQSKVLKVMGKKITRKVIELLVKMAQDSKKAEKDEDNEEVSEAEKDEDTKENQYDLFWKQFGKSIKLGVIDDKTNNKNKLQKLLRYQTSKSDGAFISLEEYIDRMKENQKAIYYITGESLEGVKNSPFLETLTAKDYEVVYMTDPLDEYVTQQMSEFDGNPLQSVSREGLNIEGEKKNLLKKQREEFKPLTEWMKQKLGDKVEKVVVSNRIAKSPCVLVAGQYGWSANMERIMRAQTFANPEQAQFMFSRKTMEINPRHPIIKELLSRVQGGSSEAQITDLVNLLYDGALINSGYTMKETSDFASRLNRVIANGLNVDPDASIEAEPEHDIEDEKPVSHEEPAETVSEDELKDDEPTASTTATDSTHDEL